jgi:SAM-dependent methyltransferase
MGWSPAKRKGWHALVPALTFVPYSPLEKLAAALPSGARIADLGAGGRRVTPGTICVDLLPAEGTTLLADLQALPFADGSLDCVICTGTLEHVQDPQRAIREIARVLRPKGVAHVEIPFLQPFHADPHDYHRWTLPGLCLAMERAGLTRREAGTHMGPANALAVFLQECFALFAPTPLLRKVFRVGICYALFWVKYLDYFLVRRKHAHVVASGFYFVGVKDGTSS